MPEFETPPVSPHDAETFDRIDLIGATTGTIVLTSKAAADVSYRHKMDADGTMYFGPGDGSFDVAFKRTGVGVLGATTDNAYDFGGSSNRWRDLRWGRQALGPDGAATSGNVSYSFASDPDTGFFLATANVPAIAAGALTPMAWSGTSARMQNVVTLTWTDGSAAGGSADLILRRRSTGVLQQSNTTNPQQWWIYGTTDSDTSPVNYERFVLTTQAGATSLIQQQGGTGTARGVTIGTAGSAPLILLTNNTSAWAVQSDQSFRASSDNAFDLGVSSRPRNIYWGTQAFGPNGTVSAPSFAFASDTGSGMFLIGSNDIAFSLGGVAGFRVSRANGQVEMNSAYEFGWASGNPDVTTLDTKLVRDAANVVAMKNSTTAQTFRVYGTWTDASNFERTEIVAAAGTCFVRQTQAGTGTARALQVGTVGSASLIFMTNNTQRWYVHPSAGDFRAITDNSFDIGTSGNERPRSIYVGTTVFTGSNTAGNIIALNANCAAGSQRDIVFQTAGVDRWFLRVDATAEGGANAGSNFGIVARDDAGANLGTYLSIVRSTAKITFSGAFALNGAQTVATDNSFDLGASGATRFRSVYLGTSIIIGTNPASSGAVRLAYADQIQTRNAANSGNYDLITAATVNAVTDIVRVGASSAGVQLLARSGGAAPTTSDIPAGFWCVWRDTVGATTKLYYNNAGAIQSVALA